MATELILPRVDMDMSEGKIAYWYVKNGDAVAKGQVVFEIETDKATMEIDSPADGVVQGINSEIGVTMPVGQIVGWILQPGEALPTAGASVPQFAETGDVAHENQVVDTGSTPAGVLNRTGSEIALDRAAHSSSPRPLRATPLARSIARAQGIDLQGVQGSGPDGRVLAADLVEAGSSGSNLLKPGTTANQATRLHLHWFSGEVKPANGAEKFAPVVLLHGFGTSLGSWRPLSQELTDLPVVGIDLPNHGKSPRLPTPDLASVAQAVLHRLDEEGINDLHLVGHSMGGGVALALSGLLGPRLKSLTLIAPAAMGPEINGAFVQGLVRASREESLRPWLALLFGNASALTGSFVATAWQELDTVERRGGLAHMADRLWPDGTQAELLREKLHALVVPVKLIWGSLDRVMPYHHSANLPGAVGLHSLAGVGHLPQVEAVPLVAMLLRQQIGAAGVLLPGAGVAPCS